MVPVLVVVVVGVPVVSFVADVGRRGRHGRQLVPLLLHVFQGLDQWHDAIEDGFFDEQLQLVEVVRYREVVGAKEVEDVAEHLAVAVDEVVLLQTVQYYGYIAIEHVGQL